MVDGTGRTAISRRRDEKFLPYELCAYRGFLVPSSGDAQALIPKNPLADDLATRRTTGPKRMRAVDSGKVFCIGSGKTGTTSMGAAFSLLGYQLGDQAGGELLIEAWAKRDFRPIIEYCHTADAFQDIPFCLDHTYIALDEAFPGSKFVLTLRKNSSEWYDSMVRFHTEIIGKHRLPTADDLKEFTYCYTGWIWRAHTLIYGCDESTLFDRELYIRQYRSHAAGVIDYFRNRPGDLLILNVSHPDAMDRLCRFLGKQRNGLEMPHLNSSCAAA